MDLEKRVESKGIKNFQLSIQHVPAHAMDFGNLEADWNVGYILDKYLTFRNLLDSNLKDTQLLQQNVYKSKRLRLIKQDHKLAVDPKHITTTYKVGDVVSIKNHPLSSAGYCLKAKFMSRYTGEYKVLGRLSGNAY